jgi:hypothetical protein
MKNEHQIARHDIEDALWAAKPPAERLTAGYPPSFETTSTL